MKKYLKFCFAFLCSSALMAQENQLPNIGFEDWSFSNTSETLDDWISSEMEYPGSGLATKATGYTNDFSLRLESKSIDGEPTFGFAILGNFGDLGPNEHVYYPYPVDSITFYMRHSMVGNDSLTLVFSQRNTGFEPTVEFKTVGGEQTDWTRYSFALPAATQDSFLIAVASGNAMQGITNIGSWLEIDNVQLVSSITGNGPALPNNDFENWTTTAELDLNGWYSFNSFFPPGMDGNMSQSNNAYTGSYAVELETFEAFGDTIPGFLSLGPINNGGDFGAVPFTANPTEISLAYNYNPAGNDTAFVFMQFFSNDVTIYQQIIPLANTSGIYLPLTVPLQAFATPDSLSLIAYSGDNVGSVLLLDDMEFKGGNVGLEEQALKAIQLYPNPSTGMVSLRFESAMSNPIISVYNLQGALVHREQVVLNGTTLERDFGSLSPGQYILEVQGENQHHSLPLIIQ